MGCRELDHLTSHVPVIPICVLRSRGVGGTFRTEHRRQVGMGRQAGLEVAKWESSAWMWGWVTLPQKGPAGERGQA